MEAKAIKLGSWDCEISLSIVELYCRNRLVLYYLFLNRRSFPEPAGPGRGYLVIL